MPRKRYEWTETIPKLTLAEKRHLTWRIRWAIFNYKLTRLRKFYRLRENINHIKTAFSTLHPFIGLSIQSALICFCLLNILPQEPISIIVAFGGGISIAINLHAFQLLFSRILPGH